MRVAAMGCMMNVDNLNRLRNGIRRISVWSFIFYLVSSISLYVWAIEDDQPIFEEPTLVALSDETKEFDHWNSVSNESYSNESDLCSDVKFSLSSCIYQVRLSAWLDLERNIVAQSREEGNEDILLASSRSDRQTNVSLSSSRRYPVGSQTFSWRDASRNRTVPVRIFYPATSDNEVFPVIVFSHGLGGSPNRCAYLGRAWASSGFVAVLLQHPGSDENVWKGKIRILYELKEAYKFNWSGRTRANDIRFALNCLDQMVAQQSWIGNKMNLSRIGVGGYDLGALASLLVAGQEPPDRGPSLYDPRVKAVLAMSPPVNQIGKSYQQVYRTIDVPTFFVTGTEDDGIVGSTKAHQRRIPFDSMSDNNRYLVVLQGADHQVYGGHMLSFRARNDKPFQAAIVRSSNHFWQGHLREQDQSLEILNGRGLNSVLGGMARIERRIQPIQQQDPSLPQEVTPETKADNAEEIAADQRPSKSTIGQKNTATTGETQRDLDKSEKTEINDNEASAELKSDFPLTRYYRSIVTKFEEDSSL